LTSQVSGYRFEDYYLPAVDADAAFGAGPDQCVASEQADPGFALGCGFADGFRGELGGGHDEHALVDSKGSAQFADDPPRDRV
jgi:hypothetical protein